GPAPLGRPGEPGRDGGSPGRLGRRRLARRVAERVETPPASGRGGQGRGHPRPNSAAGQRRVPGSGTSDTRTGANGQLCGDGLATSSERIPVCRGETARRGSAEQTG